MTLYFKYGVRFAIAALIMAVFHFTFGALAVGILMAAPPLAMTEDQLAELRKAIGDIKDGWSGIKGLPDQVKKLLADHEALRKEHDEAKKKADEELQKAVAELNKLRKIQLQRGSIGGSVRRPGFVTDECALRIASINTISNARMGRLDGAPNRDALIKSACESLGIEMKATLTTGDIPLPTTDIGEIRELASEYGVVRRAFSPFPIGRGTYRFRRGGTMEDFLFISMASAFTERGANIAYGELGSHKIGGIVRYPREIDEQSIIALGQFLARHGARKFAKMEDTVGFLADGTNAHESIVGVCKAAADLNKVVILGNTKTAPSDATIDSFRAMRGHVAASILGSGKYYLHPTWERRLRTFKTQADPMIYVHNGPGGPTLDGFPVVWTEIMAPYGEAATPSTYLAVFGDLSYWLFGEHGSPRIDISADVYFSTDELATRFIEEIDVDYADSACASALRTAAA